mmetsp:Transcript_43133/g.78923  ORF Transcript_43133/g.78923 Transcript_43133/m.78923 type:complete len:86 (-) Transcript_43133:178-435(-)
MLAPRTAAAYHDQRGAYLQTQAMQMHEKTNKINNKTIGMKVQKEFTAREVWEACRSRARSKRQSCCVCEVASPEDLARLELIAAK